MAYRFLSRIRGRPRPEEAVLVRAIRSSRWFGLLGGGRQPCLQARSEVRIIQKEPLQIQIRVNPLKKPPIPPVYSSRDWVSGEPYADGGRVEGGGCPPARSVEDTQGSERYFARRARLPAHATSPVIRAAAIGRGSEFVNITEPHPSTRGALIKGLKATKQIGHGGRGQGTWTLTGTIVNRSGRAASQATLLAVFLDQEKPRFTGISRSSRRRKPPRNRRLRGR